jgi:hypothetical protein
MGEEISRKLFTDQDFKNKAISDRLLLDHLWTFVIVKRPFIVYFRTLNGQKRFFLPNDPER